MRKMMRCLTALSAAALLAAPAARAEPSQSLGSLKNLTCVGATCNLVASVNSSATLTVPLRLSFFAPAIVRWWLAVDGNFSNSTGAPEVLVGKAQPVTIVASDAGAYFEISQAAPPTPNVVVRVQKSPLLLTILVDGQAVAQESSPLAWNSTSSWQTLVRDAAPFPTGLSAEYFYGGGMQNGRFSHRDQSITIGVDYEWEDKGHPNSAPWYLSSAGYGVYRNTWAPGAYSFGSPVVTAHNESSRLDAFFTLAGPGDMKQLLGLYTYLTGTPFLLPIYGLFLGDSDCYHNDRHGNSTRVAIALARLYEQHDMPRGWMLINDGYGCGYGEPSDGPFPSNLTDLIYVSGELAKLGFTTGLWTSTGLKNFQAEVSQAGVRICKTDVGWIGDGYKFAFDGVSLCANGIEDYSTPPARRFVWTVEGWAGTHRLAVMWTGDDSGDMDYVRWQIPTFVGSGFSAQAYTSGDIDGIFGGSPESQVRDLQFKAFTPAIMTMSGWAANPDKQPWTWGEPFVSYNRAALKLKARLTPYMYSFCREAYESGVPPVRAMLLEFPKDEALYAPSDGSNYQFLSGASMLVAPVHEQGAVTRNGIYLPAGSLWVDWWDGSRFAGGQTLNGYPAPLSTIPLFIRAGSIIPLWPEMNFYNQAPADPMYLELWPTANSSFTLYEDDGVTRAALPPTNAYAVILISLSAPPNYLNSSSTGNVTLTVGPAQGTYDGQLAQRGWWLNVRSLSPPVAVVLAPGDGSGPLPLLKMQSEAELEFETAGWYHDASLQHGLLMVKLPSQAAAAGFSVTISNGPSFQHLGTESCDTPSHHQVDNQKFAFDAVTGKFTEVTDGSPPLCITVGQDVDPDSRTPAVELQACDPSLDDRQQFVVIASSNQLALKADPTQCIDQDVSVNRLIMYSCHEESDPGNQAWSLNPDGSQHIVSVDNGLCVCVLPAA